MKKCAPLKDIGSQKCVDRMPVQWLDGILENVLICFETIIKAMNFKQLTFFLILLLVVPLFTSSFLTVKAETTQPSENLYFGVDVAFGSITATEQLIDNVSSYTNFFVIGCTGSYNLTRLSIISQYVYDKGLTFIVYSDNPRYPSSQWLQDAQENYGSKFLGIYYLDEIGGNQLDQSNIALIKSAQNYSDAANQYVNYLNWVLRGGNYSITRSFDSPTQFQLFTSDYAYYWYDYEAGYDTVFAEFTGNYSRQLNIALCRGAAAVQNKDWGVMITWMYTQPPYMESGDALYNDMLLAYQNGAKYIIVFDSNQNYTQNVLTQDQLNTMKEFWQYAQANPRTPTPTDERTAYVLPLDYAYGFRGPADKIWGLWPPDALTIDIGMSVSTLLQMDGSSLDIVYPDETQALQTAGYGSIVYWNNTSLIPVMPTITDPTPVTSVPTRQPTATSNPRVILAFPHVNPVILYVIMAIILAVLLAAFSLLKFKRGSKKIA